MTVNKILLMGPFPPPTGGDSISTRRLYRSRYWREAGIELARIDTSPHGEIRLPHEKLKIADMFRAFGILARLLVRLPRAGALLLWGNSRFICTAGVPVIILSALVGRPVVVKFFGGYLVERINRLPSLWRRVVVWTLGRSRFVLPQTYQLREELANDIGLGEERVVTFPNFIPDDFAGDQPENKEFTGRCLFMGQIKENKGIFEIIGALGGEEGISCDFYGDVDPRDRDSFEAEISGYDNCSYHGVADPQDVPGIMRGYDLLLLPTRHVGEGYPAVIMEAFASGLAVVASRWMSIPDLVEDGGRGLLVRPGSAEDIRKAVRRLQSDNRLFNDIRMNGYHFVSKFSEEAVVRHLLIGEILNGLQN